MKLFFTGIGAAVTTAIIVVLVIIVKNVFTIMRAGSRGDLELLGTIAKRIEYNPLHSLKEWLVVRSALPYLTDSSKVKFLANAFSLRTGKYRLLREYVNTKGVNSPTEFRFFCELIDSKNHGGAEAMQAIWQASRHVMVVPGEMDQLQKVCFALTDHPMLEKEMALLVAELTDVLLDYLPDVQSMCQFVKEHVHSSNAKATFLLAFAQKGMPQTLRDKVNLIEAYNGSQKLVRQFIAGVLDTTFPLLKPDVKADLKTFCRLAGYLAAYSKNAEVMREMEDAFF